jgi:hypothetical protein
MKIGWKCIKIVYWELELAETDNVMDEMLQMQKTEANNTFAKFIKKNYIGCLKIRKHVP